MITNPARTETKKLLDSLNTVILGKAEVMELLTASLLAGGHVLLEDVPGVGKTTVAKALARLLGLSFRRIQFTSDMLPSDILGVSVLENGLGTFRFRPGPIFAQLILADELNRTPPRTQSALLEAMSEGQVTVDLETRPLPKPFFVIATQNPLELHGTYPLPESQMDRFFVSLTLGYPSDAEERRVIILDDEDRRIGAMSAVATPEDLLRWRAEVEKVRVDEALVAYMQNIIKGTRVAGQIKLGAGPRAGMALFRSARALAFLRGRDFVVPEDIRVLAPAVLRHRLRLTGTQGTNLAESTNLVLSIMDAVPIP
jgi:MoxR-like ATPase